MSICEKPDRSKILAAPPLKQYRKSDMYPMCLVNKSILGHENESYNEKPIPIYEFPDASDLDKSYYIPSKGIYVIPYDRPETIIVGRLNPYYADEVVKRCQMQKNGSILPVELRRASINRIYHTYLTGALPVIAAGEYTMINNKEIVINNSSGHYVPSNNTLVYAECLFQKKGYHVTVKKVSSKENKNVLFFQNSKPLDYWTKEEWHSTVEPKALGAGAIEGGKRKIKKQRTKKNKTRRMRGKNI